jgi:hypothetical protein
VPTRVLYDYCLLVMEFEILTRYNFNWSLDNTLNQALVPERTLEKLWANIKEENHWLIFNIIIIVAVTSKYWEMASHISYFLIVCISWKIVIFQDFQVILFDWEWSIFVLLPSLAENLQITSDTYGYCCFTSNSFSPMFSCVCGHLINNHNASCSLIDDCSMLPGSPLVPGCLICYPVLGSRMSKICPLSSAWSLLS